MPFKKGETPKGAKVFKKGQSGNPRGKPTGTKHVPSKERFLKLLSLVREKKNPLTNKEAKMTLMEWMDTAMILKALSGSFLHYKEIMDRVEGKVTDKTEITGADGGPVETVIKIGYGNKKL